MESKISFQDQNHKRFLKGHLGERIVKEFIEKKGWIVYRHTGDHAHLFDFFITKNSEIRIVEVKAKARFNKWRKTGINKSHFNTYMRVQRKYGLRVVLIFVDEHPKQENIYYQYLDKLLPGEPLTTWNSQQLVIFPISKMIELWKLTKKDLHYLRTLSTRSCDYNEEHNENDLGLSLL